VFCTILSVYIVMAKLAAYLMHISHILLMPYMISFVSVCNCASVCMSTVFAENPSLLADVILKSKLTRVQLW